MDPNRDQNVFDGSMNDFTQDFLAVAWENEGDNFVFSPFSLHSVLSMLTSGAEDNSDTQKELLNAFGSTANLKLLNHFYGQFVENYKGTDVEKTLQFGNRLWTSEKHFQKIEEDYKNTIKETYDAEFDILSDTSPEKPINDWVKNITQGKIDQIVGKFSSR